MSYILLYLPESILCYLIAYFYHATFHMQTLRFLHYIYLTATASSYFEFAN